MGGQFENKKGKGNIHVRKADLHIKKNSWSSIGYLEGSGRRLWDMNKVFVIKLK